MDRLLILTFMVIQILHFRKSCNLSLVIFDGLIFSEDFVCNCVVLKYVLHSIWMPLIAHVVWLTYENGMAAYSLTSLNTDMWHITYI